ncbi:hypothetical protein BsWGS_17834 [Bradybaena similaris]
MENLGLSNTCRVETTEICRKIYAYCFLGCKRCPIEKLSTLWQHSGQFYADIHTKLRMVVTRKCGIARTQNLSLLQDTAPSHKAWLVQVAANDLNIEVLPHSPNSPDLAPSDILHF